MPAQELQPGENRGVYVVKGDARDPRNLLEMGEGLVPDRYEYIKVRLDKDDPSDPTPAVGTVGLDFRSETAIVDIRDGEEITINREVNFRGLQRLETNLKAQITLTGKALGPKTNG